jgi:hypothetical protein
MKRFSMSFDNPAQNAVRQSILYNAQMQAQKAKPYAGSKKIDLALPMIDRVYKAKPGCSACGK